MMNILLAGQAYYRRDNGQAVFTINLAEQLAATGHCVLVLAPSETGQAVRTVQNGVDIQTAPALSLINNTNVTAFSGRLVARTLDDFQPDVVHIQDHYFLSRSVLAAAQQRGIITVGTNHFLPENLTDNLPFAQWAHQPLNHLLWSTMLAVYNRLQAVSIPTETAAAILRVQGLQVPVTAISCGVNVERFQPRPTLERTIMRQHYGLAMDKTIFLYVGRLDREKDLDLMIKAFAQLERQDVQFAIGGKGGYRPALEQLCHARALGDKVIFPGFVAEADLPALLNSVDIFVMPSHAELQSIATLEAMASGLPILAANARALPELVEQGVNGYLFAAKDRGDAACAVNTIAEQQTDWAAMGRASRRKAERHAHANVIAQYMRWYQQPVTHPQIRRTMTTVLPAA